MQPKSITVELHYAERRAPIRHVWVVLPHLSRLSRAWLIGAAIRELVETQYIYLREGVTIKVVSVE